MHELPERSDLAIIGGGPAGLAVAIQARLRGLSAVVLDSARPPIDRACGEGLMPDGWQSLERLGVEISDEHRARIEGITYVMDSLRFSGRFGEHPGYGLRRTILHGALVRRAQALGARLFWGCKVTDFRESGVRCEAGEVQASWIVGADGRRSKVREALGLSKDTGRRRRFGVRKHYAIEPWTECVEVYWGPGCEAYVTPVSREQVGVAFLWSGKSHRWQTFLDFFPNLRDRLVGAQECTSALGAGPLEGHSKKVAVGRTALVGDASGFVDAIAGEGLSLAFLQAEALVSAICLDDLSAYERAHRDLIRTPRSLTRLLLALEQRPSLLQRVFHALAADEALFGRFLDLHTRQGGFKDLRWSSLARLLRRVAWQW